MATDSTSISSLMTDLANPQNGENVRFAISEQPTTAQLPLPVNVNQEEKTLDQNTIQQIINGIQQASATGATLLPSRDIPQHTTTITQDPHIQPNYIPPSSMKDYIRDQQTRETRETREQIIETYENREQQNQTLESVYNDLQLPILLFVLYFLFQLPVFKKYLFLYIPFLFSHDGNYNFQGYLFTSSLFAFFFYTIHHVLAQFQVV